MDEKIVQLEKCIIKIISSIQKVIGNIRDVKAFSSIDKITLIKKTNLFHHFETNGIVEDVKKTIHFVEKTLESKIYLADDTDNSEFGVCRKQVVYLIIFPLLKSLHECYRLLDPTLQAIQVKESARGKPEAPKGMLSLQNYTDIGAILEFAVCTSIIPCLEDNILTPIRDRAQYLLPRSIAGRLPRMCLLWGVEASSKITKEQRISELKLIAPTIGKILLLDRFRPMFLPRHLADIYAALFQIEYLESSKNQQERANLGFAGKEFISFKRLMFSGIDELYQAKALQTLLLFGMKTPVWIRKKASILLTDLAVRDVCAIIQVFVNSIPSSQEDRTGAALRVASALVVSANEEVHKEKICQNIVSLLEYDDKLTPEKHHLHSLVAWAFIQLLPKKRLINSFLPKICDGLVQIKDLNATHKSLKRLISLLSSVPIQTHNTNSICIMLLSALPNVPGVNILNQILRLASFPRVEKTELKLDAVKALRLACINITHATSFDGISVSGQELLSIALIRSISLNKWDVSGFQNELHSSSDAENNEKALEILNSECEKANNTSLAGTVERRANVVISEVILFSEEISIDPAVKFCPNLPKVFFQNLLLIAFEVIPTGKCKSLFSSLHTSVMIILPILCDQCHQEKLLLGASSDSTGILNTFKIIIDYAAIFMDPSHQLTEQISDRQSAYIVANRILLQISGSTYESNIKGRDGEDQFFKEFIMSTTSMILSSLLVILELGSKQRKQQELDILNSCTKSLQVLSSVVLKEKIGVDLARLHSEIAEMASHAVLLIISQTSKTQEHSTHESAEQKTVDMVLKNVSQKLNSTSTAIRAEGAVKLRHLARACLEERGEQLQNQPMIQEISEPLSVLSSDLSILEKILKLAVSTLKDSESYVFLAGIHTISAIADVKPQFVIPVISLAIATGVLNLSMNSSSLILEEDDRVKLAEALIFIVRRRGKAINHYVPYLLGAMIHGNLQSGKNYTESAAKVIQARTHEYFFEGIEDANELTLASEYLERKNLRVNTGGPIFEVEQHDVLRSSCIFLIAEVVNFSFPSSTIPYIYELVRVVINILNLEKSRPMRRAVAFLATSIYGAALREVSGDFEGKSLIIALVRSKEAVMESVLVKAKAQDPANPESYDPALVARCEEALHTRTALEDAGAFSVAALHLEEEKRDDGNQKISFIKKRLNENI